MTLFATRPTCVHCGNKYGSRRTDTVYAVWLEGTPKPEYRGNGIVSRERMMQTAPHNTTGSYMGQKFGPHDNVVQRYIWTGEWYASYAPFCTLRCALDYARKAYARTKSNLKVVK